MQRFLPVLLLMALSCAYLSGCGHGDGNGGPIWVVPRAEVPECLSDLVDGILKDARPASYVLRYPGEILNAFYYNTKLPEDYNWVLSVGCIMQCAPDGGPDGNGDGSCPEFFNEHTDAEIVWCESREICNSIDKPLK